MRRNPRTRKELGAVFGDGVDVRRVLFWVLGVVCALRVVNLGIQYGGQGTGSKDRSIGGSRFSEDVVEHRFGRSISSFSSAPSAN